MPDSCALEQWWPRKTLMYAMVGRTAERYMGVANNFSESQGLDLDVMAFAHDG